MFARSADINIHYESAGEGPPVLLVMGLGMAGNAWWRTQRTLAGSLRVLTFDNRGAGRSDAPDGPYTVPDMAADAVSVLDAAGTPRAHVYGMSLGGMIAQELALTHPHRVERLVLAATSAGGSAATAPDELTLGFLERRAQMPLEEAAWASVPYLYSARTRRRHGGRIGEDIVRRLRLPIAAEPYRWQLAAARGHNAAERLGAISVPTLVVHGEEDRMVPAQNGRRLAELIPDAELHLCGDAGHLYTTDDPSADHQILRFLLDQPLSRGARGSSRGRSARVARA